MRISVLTLGCKTNQAESMSIENALHESGHKIVDIAEEPDICIINTCSVTSKADYQSRQLIKKALKINSKVIVTGCYAELNKNQLNKITDDVIIIENSKKDSIINLIEANSLTDNITFSVSNDSHQKTRLLISRHRPFVKVQDGCNYSCSYCAIPIARGRSKSIHPDNVIKDIFEYEAAGYKEIVLTGIHLGTYGVDLVPETSIASLVKTILVYSNIPRIRLSSLEIREIDDELLELFSDNRICKHLHIPLQSGDDNILKLMNRHYSVKEFSRGIERILKKIPDISIGTDVIVGFPGETDVSFNNTKNFIESTAFAYIHVFPYSKRPGTRAVSLPDHVPEHIKKERVNILRDIGKLKKEFYIKNNIGKIVDVILENRYNNGFLGTTRNYIKVFLDCNNNFYEGMLVNVKITGTKGDHATAFVTEILQPFNN